MQFSLPEYIKREPGNRSGQKYKSVLKGEAVPQVERGSGELLGRTRRRLTSHFQIKPLRKPNWATGGSEQAGTRMRNAA